MRANHRMAILRCALQSHDVILSLGSEPYQDVWGILYSWPLEDLEGLQIATDYAKEVLERTRRLTEMGTSYRMGLKQALSVVDMFQDFENRAAALLKNPGSAHMARACCWEKRFSLGPTKEVIVKKSWRPLERAEAETGVGRRGPYSRSLGGRWYTEYARAEDCRTEFGKVFEVSNLPYATF